MADTKTLDLTDLTAPVAADKLMVVDVSDTTMDATGTNKDMTLGYLTEAIGAGNYNPVSDVGATAWVMPGLISPNSTNGAGTANVANELTYEPWLITQRCTLIALALDVTTLNATATVRVGVYKADKEWQPTDLVVDGGDFSMASAVKVSVTGLSAVMEPGRYLAARNASASFGALAMFARISVAGSFHAASSLNSHAVKFTKSGVTYGAFPSTGDQWDSMASASDPSIRCGIMARFT